MIAAPAHQRSQRFGGGRNRNRSGYDSEDPGSLGVRGSGPFVIAPDPEKAGRRHGCDGPAFSTGGDCPEPWAPGTPYNFESRLTIAAIRLLMG